jgi:hypothetical protein
VLLNLRAKSKRFQRRLQNENRTCGRRWPCGPYGGR